MNNSVNWDRIIITQAELDNLLPANILYDWAIDLCRVLILRKRKYLQILIRTEAVILFLEIILLFPLNLIILRNVGIIENNSYGLIIILLLSIAIALLLLLLLNYWLWHKAKRLRKIGIILEKVEDFNHLIENLKTLTDLSNFNNCTAQDHDGSSIKLSEPNLLQNSAESSFNLEDILLTTRTSLIQSLKIYHTLYLKTKHNQDVEQVFANLEHKLTHFISLPLDNNSKVYQQTLAEIINLGLTVHREIIKKNS